MFTTGKKVCEFLEWQYWMAHASLFPAQSQERREQSKNVSINVNTAMQIKKLLSKEVTFIDVGHFCI